MASTSSPLSTSAGKPCAKFLMLWDDHYLPRLYDLNLRDMEVGIDLVCVHSREAALDALATDSFAAIVLNVISAIPGGGLKFIEELQRRNNPIPVIILTAAARKSDIEDVKFTTPDSDFPGLPAIFAVVPQPASIETMLKVFNAVLNRGVQPPANGAAL